MINREKRSKGSVSFISKKKGSMPPEVIVGLFVIIIAFALTVYLYSQAIDKPTFDRETCKASAVARGSSPEEKNIQDIVELRCQTRKVCIGGDCDEFIGEEKVINKKDIPEGEEGREKIEKIIVEELFGCWKMLGEGKLSLYSKSIVEYISFSGKVYAGCVICSRIAFNEENIPESVNLNEVDPIYYMATHKVPGKEEKISYFEYLTKEKAKFSSKGDLVYEEDEEKIKELSENLEKAEEKIDEGSDEEIEETSDRGDTKEIAVIFQQVSGAPGRLEALKKLGLGALGVGAGSNFLTFGGTTKAGGAVITKFPVIAGLIAGGTVGVQQINVVRQRAFAAGYCGDISYGDETHAGCSSVRLVNYNVEDIKQKCPFIDSIP